MTLARLPDLILYGRPGCGLCDETRTFVTELLEARRAAGLRAPGLVERDIQSDPRWEREYFDTIPVIELGGRRLEMATSAARVTRLLTDVLDA